MNPALQNKGGSGETTIASSGTMDNTLKVISWERIFISKKI